MSSSMSTRSGRSAWLIQWVVAILVCSAGAPRGAVGTMPPGVGWGAISLSPAPVFATVDFAIVATAGHGGSLTPTGIVTVPGGTDQTFTITPDAGYTVYDVRVDGVSVGGSTEYMFPGVAANHTIEALFILHDEFTAGLGSWSPVLGAWKTSTGASLVSPATKPGILVLGKDSAPDLQALSAGLLQASVKLTATAVSTPNAALVFAYQDSAHYRYVRLKPGKLLIGQVGSFDGAITAVYATYRNENIRKGSWGSLIVIVQPDGTVDATMPTIASGTLASWKFASALTGGAGFQTAKAKSLFDQVYILDQPVSATDLE